MQEMGWLSIRIFKFIYFDTSFWSVWNLDYAESDRSVNPVGVSQPRPWACTFSLLKPPLHNWIWSGKTCRIVYSWTQRCRLTMSAEETKLSGEVDTWEGRANLQETRTGWKSVQTIFYLSAQPRHWSTAPTCAGETAESCPPLSRRWRALRAAGSEMCHMLTEFESPSGGAAQAAEGHRSELLCAQTSALPSIFQCSPSWHSQG